MASVTFLHVKLRDGKEAWLNPWAVEFVSTDKDGDTLVGMDSGNTICPDLPPTTVLNLIKDARGFIGSPNLKFIEEVLPE